jgi:hypothetical protein
MVALRAEISQAEVTLDRRGAPRRTLRLAAQIAETQTTREVLILDLSTMGLMIETAIALTIGETIEVELPHVGPISARVIWNREAYFGCEFLSPVPAAAVSAALLRSAPLEVGVPPSLGKPITAPAFKNSALPKIKSASQGMTMLSLTLLLIVVVTFMLALLTLPFSTDQFGR